MNDTTIDSSHPATDGNGGKALAIAAIAVAVILQLVVLVPFTVSSGLLAPLWAIVVLYAVWLGAAVTLVTVARRRPLATPLVPIVNAAVWWGLMTFGESVLGWTA
jgi:hypothetical protein